jgi:hypothetical protein
MITFSFCFHSPTISNHTFTTTAAYHATMSDVAMPDSWDPSLEGLPDELLQEIFEYLRPKRWWPSLGDNMGPLWTGR